MKNSQEFLLELNDSVFLGDCL